MSVITSANKTDSHWVCFYSLFYTLEGIAELASKVKWLGNLLAGLTCHSVESLSRRPRSLLSSNASARERDVFPAGRPLRSLKCRWGARVRTEGSGGPAKSSPASLLKALHGKHGSFSADTAWGSIAMETWFLMCMCIFCVCGCTFMLRCVCT